MVPPLSSPSRPLYKPQPFPPTNYSNSHFQIQRKEAKENRTLLHLLLIKFTMCKSPASPAPVTSDDDAHCTLLPKKQPQNHSGSDDESSSLSVNMKEACSILSLSLPMILTQLLLYSRSAISMLFLGRLGDLPLAGGSLAIGFANITGYSVLSGLSSGIEPICSQSFGAHRHSHLGLALHRSVLLLLTVSLPISLLWLNIKPLLLLCSQPSDIASVAHSYILFSLPDLLLSSCLHPLRVYLRTQSITMPLTYSAAVALLLHLPANYLLVHHLGLGVRGVALASVWTNLNLLLLLLAYTYLSGVYGRTGGFAPISETFHGWGPLLNLAVPSCVSVCLEWWWYEIMIVLCGLLINPRAAVASMGVLIQTTSLIYIFPSSLSFGVSTRVGNELGANRPSSAWRSARVGMAISFVFGFLALGFGVSVRNVWAGIFTSDAGIKALTSAVLPVLGLCELGNCPQTTGCGVLRGSARPRAGANINLGSFYGVGMPVAVGLAFWGGMDFRGLWFGLLSAQMTCAVTMVVVIGRTDWGMQARRAQRLTQGAEEEQCEGLKADHQNTIKPIKEKKNEYSSLV